MTGRLRRQRVLDGGGDGIQRQFFLRLGFLSIGATEWSAVRRIGDPCAETLDGVHVRMRVSFVLDHEKMIKV